VNPPLRHRPQDGFERDPGDHDIGKTELPEAVVGFCDLAYRCVHASSSSFGQRRAAALTDVAVRWRFRTRNNRAPVRRDDALAAAAALIPNRLCATQRRLVLILH
jgi:hypothetical protein